MSAGAVCLFVTRESRFGDAVEELASDLDAPAALAGGFEVFPALPADAGRGFDEDGEVDGGEQGVVEGVDAFDDDEAIGCCGRRDFALADAAVGLEGPGWHACDAAGAERGEVLEQAGVIGEAGIVAVVVGDLVVVGEVVVGAEDAGREEAGEVGLAGADGAGDGDDGGSAGGKQRADRGGSLIQRHACGLCFGPRHAARLRERVRERG